MHTNGPGKYDPECTELRERLMAAGVVLIVHGGMRGDGFEVQMDGLALLSLPAVLRDMATQIEAQLLGEQPA